MLRIPGPGFVSSLPAAAVVGVLALTGCGSPAPSAEAPPAETAAAAPENHMAHAAGRVFFVMPQDGAMVTSPVHFEFGSEALQIAAVPQGTVTAVRPETGHFHLGVDTECLPAGAVIPKAAPWIHFGDGKNVIDMQLEPGPHRFAVQAGDDLHQTIEGLCETVSVTVTR